MSHRTYQPPLRPAKPGSRPRRVLPDALGLLGDETVSEEEAPTAKQQERKAVKLVNDWRRVTLRVGYTLTHACRQRVLSHWAEARAALADAADHPIAAAKKTNVGTDVERWLNVHTGT